MVNLRRARKARLKVGGGGVLEATRAIGILGIDMTALEAIMNNCYGKDWVFEFLCFRFYDLRLTLYNQLFFTCAPIGTIGER